MTAFTLFTSPRREGDELSVPIPDTYRVSVDVMDLGNASVPRFIKRFEGSLTLLEHAYPQSDFPAPLQTYHHNSPRKDAEFALVIDRKTNDGWERLTFDPRLTKETP